MHKWTEGNDSLRITTFYPWDIVMHAGGNMRGTAGMKRRMKTTKRGWAVGDTVAQISVSTADASLCFGHPGIRASEHCLLGYQGISEDSPTLYHPPPALPLLSVLFPWRQKGQNKTSKQLQNSPDTNSFPHVTLRGLAGLLDYPDSGMSQPPALCYLITSGGDGMPFWRSDYGQSDIDLKGARWEENLQGPICGSCWAQMRWGNGSSFKGMLLAVKDHKWLQLGTILRKNSKGWDSLHGQLFKLVLDVLTLKHAGLRGEVFELKAQVERSVHKKLFFHSLEEKLESNCESNVVLRTRVFQISACKSFATTAA